MRFIEEVPLTSRRESAQNRELEPEAAPAVRVSRENWQERHPQLLWVERRETQLFPGLA